MAASLFPEEACPEEEKRRERKKALLLEEIKKAEDRLTAAKVVFGALFPEPSREIKPVGGLVRSLLKKIDEKEEAAENPLPKISQQQRRKDINGATTTLFIGNLPFRSFESPQRVEDTLRQLFSKCGPLRQVKPNVAGFAHCQFIHLQDAIEAYRQFDNYYLNGRPIRVDFAHSKEEKRLKQPHDHRPFHSLQGPHFQERNKYLPSSPKNYHRDYSPTPENPKTARYSEQDYAQMTGFSAPGVISTAHPQNNAGSPNFSFVPPPPPSDLHSAHTTSRDPSRQRHHPNRQPPPPPPPATYGYHKAPPDDQYYFHQDQRRPPPPHHQYHPEDDYNNTNNNNKRRRFIDTL